jgi:hypothetical protein
MTSNRTIARLTALTCALTLAFFTGYVLAPTSTPPINSIEHHCTTPAQCLRLKVQYPNDDIILTPPPANPAGYTACDPTNAPELCDDNYRMIDDTAHPEVWIAMIHADHPNYDPYRCLVKVADTTIITCQDGWTETS